MKRDTTFLKHILDAILKIEEYASVGKEKFFATSSWQDAIMRKLEIIGEASKRISEETKLKYPDVPWKKMAGLRDILVHAYMSVDLNAVWEITQQNLPDLKKQIQDILMESKD